MPQPAPSSRTRLGRHPERGGFDRGTIDALLALSVFDHSVNYRSVMVFGRARLVDDPAEKLAALEAFTEHVTPGRWGDARTPNERELKATSVLAVPLDEASAKVRSGPPGDDRVAEGTSVWAGVVPLRMVAGPPEAAVSVPEGSELPVYVEAYLRDHA